jgi:Lipase (class 3)
MKGVSLKHRSEKGDFSIYEDDTNKEYVIAFRGTVKTNVDDLIDDVKIAFCSEPEWKKDDEEIRSWLLNNERKDFKSG